MVIGADGRVGLCCLDHELNEEVGMLKRIPSKKSGRVKLSMNTEKNN